MVVLIEGNNQLNVQLVPVGVPALVPGDYTITAPLVWPNPAVIGDTVKISVQATNRTPNSGSVTASCQINGEELTATINLAGYGQERIIWEYVPQEPREYTITIPLVDRYGVTHVVTISLLVGEVSIISMDIPPTLSVHGGDILTANVHVKPPQNTWGYYAAFGIYDKPWPEPGMGYSDHIIAQAMGTVQAPIEGYYSIPCEIEKALPGEKPYVYAQPGDIAYVITLEVSRGTRWADGSWSWEEVIKINLEQEVTFV